MKTAQEWRQFYKNSGAIATCMNIDWLKEGCPFCGGKKWEVTSDCYAYCMGCSNGYPTDYPFTNQFLEILDFSEGGKEEIKEFYNPK